MVGDSSDGFKRGVDDEKVHGPLTYQDVPWNPSHRSRNRREEMTVIDFS
jgi:hypothetical protein